MRFRIIGGGDESVRDDLRPGVVEHPSYWEVVNIASKESDTDRVPPEEFARRFQFEIETVDESGVATASSSSGGGDAKRERFDLRADEVWQWVALGIVGLLCLECFVANRTTA